MPTCEFTMTGYPHPGCAEFGPPDEMVCTAPATKRATWTSHMNPAPPHASYTESMLVCDEHAVEFVDDPEQPWITDTKVEAFA